MKGKKLAWMAFAALVILAVVFRAVPAASAAFLLAGAALCPLEKWQELLKKKLLLSGVLKGAAVAVLLVLGVVLTQTGAPAEESAADVPPALSQSAEPEVTPEIPPEQTPEETPEASPEQTPEETPEASPEPTPEETPEGSPEPTPEESPAVTSEPEPEKSAEPAAVNYILNTNSKKFHYPSCSGVKRMKEENKASFTGTREEAIAKGYTPCGTCKP